MILFFLRDAYSVSVLSNAFRISMLMVFVSGVAMEISQGTDVSVVR